MTQLREYSQPLVTEDSGGFNKLLEKNSSYKLKKAPRYDLEKMPGAVTPTPLEKMELLSDLNEDHKKLLRPPTPPQCDSEPSSQRSEDDYLPSTLRDAISITNNSEEMVVSQDDANTDEPNTDDPAAASPDLSRKKNDTQKKRQRSIRKSASDKSSRVPKASKETIATSLHDQAMDTSNREGKPPAPKPLERISHSEEFRRPANRDSGKNRRHSENLNQRQPSFRRESGRSRKPNSSRDLPPSKPLSFRRPKSTRDNMKRSSVSMKDLNSTQDDKPIVDWSRTLSSNKEQGEKIPKQKLKKSTSNGSNARRSKRSSSKSSRNLLQTSEVPEGDKQIDWKRRSPSVQNQKKSMKQKQESKPSEPQKLTESNPSKPKKTKSRRAMMMTSKATTDSCRDLLRKIHQINNDRLSNENRSGDIIKEESQSSNTDFLSQSARSIGQSKAIKESFEGSSSTDFLSQSMRSKSQKKATKENTESDTFGKKSQQKPLTNKSSNSNKSRRKLQDEDKPLKPSRTKSAPQIKKSKSINENMPLSKNGTFVSMTSVDAVQNKLKKKSLSSRLLGIFIEGKVARKSNDKEEVTICTGNRKKDKVERKRFLRRSKSDTSLRDKSSKYNLMVSMHSITADELETAKKKGNSENIASDIESDDCDSFAGDGEGIDASYPQVETVSSDRSDNETLPMGSEMTSVPNERARNLKDQGQGVKKKLSDHMKNSSLTNKPCNDDLSDDIMSMAEFSPQKMVKAKEVPITKKRPSCLQIDFSQLSEHGTSGNIVVRSKKLEKRASVKNGRPKSNRDIRA